MMTYISNGQFTVGSKKELIDRCEESKLRDCRLNAFPVFTYYKGIVMQPPDFVFVDLDLSNFSTANEPKKALDLALINTLRKISSTFQEPSQPSQPSQNNLDRFLKFNEVEKMKVKPTVLWTGNGYHIYLPIKAVVLDQYDLFSVARYPNLFSTLGGEYTGCSTSEIFLKFCSFFFSTGAADPQHRPKFKSCLVRIPRTLNSKCLSNGLTETESEVKIVQEWNGYRPPIQFVTKHFRRWLLQEELRKKKTVRRTSKKTIFYSGFYPNMIPWIDKLSKTPIEDYRKYCLWRILIPYLVNVKRLPSETCFATLETWLEGCNRLRKVDFGTYTVKIYFMNVKTYLPIPKERLKQEQQALYGVLKSRGVLC
jgi:hypothetical protein